MLDGDLIDSWDEHPEQSGWYPAVHCWDVEEGAYPGAMYWTGSEWLKDGQKLDCHIGWLRFRFDSKESAERFAEENLQGF